LLLDVKNVEISVFVVTILGTTLVDDCTRECPAIEVDTSLG
jgi:hypothetical protein